MNATPATRLSQIGFTYLLITAPTRTASADVHTFQLDELLGTKLRALYQRRRGRDLFDLWDATRRGDVNPVRVIEAFQAYLKAEDLRVTRAEFERNLAGKARNRLFIEEVTPLLAPGMAYDARAALDLVQREFIERLPGEAWKGA